MGANGVEQSGGYFGENVIWLDEVYARAIVWGDYEVLFCPLFEIGARVLNVFIGLGMAGERGGDGFGVGIVPDAFGRGGAGFGDFEAEFAHFGEFGNAEALDLLFESTN